MPLRDDLLNSIPGDNPSGVSLRYERIYDQIKEARTEEDESIPAGAWQRQVKKADYPLVLKLAGEALATKSKDLQLAAWLSEAHVKREGIVMVAPCLQLMLDLQNNFWDTLYPEIDEGDAGMRAVPIEWTANRIGAILREAPITKNGLSFFQYRESRAVGYESETEYNDAKREARELAVQDGKITGEEFDAGFGSTPKAFYVSLDEAIHSATQVLETLQIDCEDKYRDDGPGFGKLKAGLEEVGQVISNLLGEKRTLEPDPVAAEETAEMTEETPSEEQEEIQEDVSAAVVVPAAKPARAKSLSAEPADWDDAMKRIQDCARFMQKERPSSPIPYLLQTAVRWGEMREQGNYPAYDFLVSPPTDIRQSLKRLASEANWEELLCIATAAAGESCGRAWLDVHRYIWRASYEAGYSAISAAVLNQLQCLLKEIPEIPSWTLDDDTPAANPETQRWLEEQVIPKPAEPAPAEEPAPDSGLSYVEKIAPAEEQEDEAAPDVLSLARELIGRGQVAQAIQLLVRDAAQQPSGRARFQRRLQVAQLCITAGQNKVAYPVLEELVREIEQRSLEEWEASDVIAPPLALLLKCLDPSGDTNGQREALFSRLCRIDPIAAMDLSR
ncbi:type VI secretion system protein TssA [Paracidobacterium acidisoli]|uniref:type VI secretion system protein TssA n=1 Tax=Paracidobacterium acidisoli TaxID=2303751 RepID=UPI001314ED85|nr:type VI secretion system protein TssA [Paracidobacterium acidisoli]